MYVNMCDLVGGVSVPQAVDDPLATLRDVSSRPAIDGAVGSHRVAQLVRGDCNLGGKVRGG